MKSHKNFILAEVLITLVIVGIIAAITVPVIITGYQKKQTCIQLKKIYSELCQAVKLSEAQNGIMSNWDWDSLTGDENTRYDFFKKYLYPFITVSKDNMGDMQNEGIKYYEASGKITQQLLAMRNSAQIITLASGAQVFIAIEAHKINLTQRLGFVVDLNGFKKPNRFGRDIFSFTISPYGIFPTHNNDGESILIKRSRDELINGKSSYRYQCNKNSLGLWCAALIMADNWEIKDDYPW